MSEPGRRPAVSVPWQLLVRPVGAWQELRDHPVWWPALAGHVLLAWFSWLVTLGSVRQIDVAAGISDLFPPLKLPDSLIWLILLAAAIALGCMILAAVARWWLMLAGQIQPFRRALTWLVYSLLPLSLGQALGCLTLALVQPLTSDPAEAIALQLRPFSLGLAAFMPRWFPPLSFQWHLASFADLFGLWSLALLALGARHFLGLAPRAVLWSVLALMLLWLLVIAGLWLATQQVLVGLSA